jgi:thioredoxin-related protein
MLRAVLVFVLVLAMPGSRAAAPPPSPHAIDLPPWFVETFLDFRDDVAEAARDGRRLMLYFGQDGCPYCTKLMTTNFAQRGIAEKARRRFLPVALNLWGDRGVTWLDGRTLSEKELARELGVQFTPTLLFIDEAGAVIVRLDGYYPPQQFEAVLDYVAGRHERDGPLSDWLARHAKEKASPTLHDEPFFLRAPFDLVRRPGAKPLAVIFETVDCSACDELHREAFRRADVRNEVARFDVARFALAAPTPVTVPDGRTLTAREWARELGVAYVPGVVFFDERGREVFRISAYLRPFHFASSFAYVADGAYRDEPSFQRWLQARADRMRARGERVDLWQ